jgi:hypothetical protein
MRASVRCVFFVLFFTTVVLALVFAGVGFASAADTHSAFAGDSCAPPAGSQLDPCSGYRSLASALYGVTTLAVISTLVDVALVSCLVLVMSIKDSYQSGSSWGISTGATLYNGLILLCAASAFMGGLQVFQNAHEAEAKAADWNEAMYRAAIAFGVISGACFLLIGSLMLCCARRITTKTRDVALERLP